MDRVGFFKRLDGWMYGFYRLDPERIRREQPLRARLLKQVLAVTFGLYGLYIVLAAAGVIRSILFPWAAMEASALLLVSAWIAHKKFIAGATPFLLVSLSHVASAIVAAYSLRAPAAALFLPTIIVCGLLIGAYFVRTWTLICCGLLLVLFWRTTESWTVFCFWWGLFILCAWLVELFSRHLEGLLEASRVAEEQQRGAVVAERTRLAREIHDTLAQAFTGVVIQLNAAEQMAGSSNPHIEKARELARRSLDEARRSIWALRPAALEDGDLLSALVRIGQQLAAGTEIALETSLQGQPYALSGEVEAQLLRVGQEAITNAVRHAAAKRIEIQLRYDRQSVTLEIRDDGQGIPGAPASGFGLKGMAERMSQLRGQLKISSEAGRGTTIQAVVST